MGMKLLMSKLPPRALSVIDALQIIQDHPDKPSALMTVECELENIGVLMQDASVREVNELLSQHKRLANAKYAIENYFG